MRQITSLDAHARRALTWDIPTGRNVLRFHSEERFVEYRRAIHANEGGEREMTVRDIAYMHVGEHEAPGTTAGTGASHMAITAPVGICTPRWSLCIGYPTIVISPEVRT
jgi:hypothetical protein